MMRGFRARLSQELKSLLATPKYANLKINTFKLFQPPAQLNYVSWLGGYSACCFFRSKIIELSTFQVEQFLVQRMWL